uniref:Acyltransferase n=1 Tax=Waltergamsia fusidioides TaxID=749674 RepID=A0A411G445_9HYPO|nr:acyltransferase [Waltergamsia fusidioides]
MDGDAKDGFVSTLPRVTYPLSPLDIVVSHLYISNCFFFEGPELGFDSGCQYDNDHDDGTSFAVEQLLQSGLYRALEKFPILVGELRPSGLNTMEIAVEPERPNMPVWETTYDSVVSFDHCQTRGFHPDSWPEGLTLDGEPLLVTDDTCQSAKLLRIRVCRFAGNTGVAVLVRVAHAVFDAKGVVAFINYWATCCREEKQKKQKQQPSLGSPSGKDESVHLPESILSRDAMYRKLPIDIRPTPMSKLLSPISWVLVAILGWLAFTMRDYLTQGDSESHLFAISRKDLDAIRSEAKEASSIVISDNDVIVALFTMAYAQSREDGSKKPQSKSKVKALVPCDFRHRLDIPETFSGNCAVGLFVTASSDQLLQPIEHATLIQVASVCRKTVDSADRGVIEQLIRRAMESIKWLGPKARVLYSLMVCQAFSNQSRLGFYSSDFGFGPPVLAVPLAYPQTLAVVVPSPPESDDVYVWLSLKREQMVQLMGNRCFHSLVRVVY